jgi:hypothetical protein
MAATSSSLRNLAVSLMKIANDFRLLASGPRCGLGELEYVARAIIVIIVITAYHHLGINLIFIILLIIIVIITTITIIKIAIIQRFNHSYNSR